MSHGQSRRNVDSRLLFTLIFILVAWAFFVLNTELAIHWNQSAEQNRGSSWQFGQVWKRVLQFQDITDPFALDFANVFNIPASGQYHQRFQSVRYKAHEAG